MPSSPLCRVAALLACLPGCSSDPPRRDPGTDAAADGAAGAPDSGGRDATADAAGALADAGLDAAIPDAARAIVRREDLVGRALNGTSPPGAVVAPDFTATAWDGT